MLCTDYYLHAQMEEEGGVQDLVAFVFFSPNHSFVFWLLQDSGASLKARAKASPEKSARLKLLQIRLDESAQNRHFQSASGSQRAWPYNTTQD